MKKTKTFLTVLSIVSVLLSCGKESSPSPEGPPTVEPVIISNLDFTITVNSSDPLSIDVTPTASNASSFWVYFDTEGTPNDYTETGGTKVSHTYPAVSATYQITVVANADNAESVSLTKQHSISVEPARVITDFENVDNLCLIQDGDGLIFEVDDNPNTNGNDSNKVGKIINAGAAYEAASLALDTYIDMKTVGKQVISFDFYQEGSGSISILAKLEGSEAPEMNVYDVEVLQTVSGSGWQNVTFDFANARTNSYPNGDQPLAPLDAYGKLVLFIGFGVDLPGTFYIDNVSGGAEGNARESVVEMDYDTLIWSDEFDTGTSYDVENWTAEIGDGCPNLCGWGNGEAQFYTARADNVKVEDGLLKITAKKESYQNSSYTSARLKTEGKFTFTYGKVEVRAKLPTGAGTWPAIWMLGSNITTVGWPACGEIDIMEHVGNNQDYVHSSLHTTSSSGATVNTSTYQVAGASEEFNVYSMQWNANKIEFFLNGESTYTYAPCVKNANNWPFSNPQFILLNVAMGGSFGGNIDPNFSQSTMEIDYVRVYQ